MKIAISTGGGDCPGLNAVIRGVVRSAIFRYGWEVIGIRDGLDGLVHGWEPIPLGLDQVKGILSRGGTIIGTTNKGNPFRYEVEENGTRVVHDLSARVLDNFRATGAEALIMVGGDGTLGIGRQLMDLGIPCVFVPKTIDCDVAATDSTFGYHTAVGIVTEALDRLHTTAESHRRAMVVEVMGRYAGWIALESGIAGSADVILLPEIPYDLDAVFNKLEGRKKLGRNFSVVVVAEGALPKEGSRTVAVAAETDGRAERLGGVGQVVAQQIEEGLGIETRTVVLGHVQRGGTPSHTDRILGSRFGVEAVELIRRGEFGRMVSLKGQEIVSVPVADAIDNLRLVDPDGQLVATAEALGICCGR
ncbi:6-phosphofructokinase [Geothermobacter hydrogeniphilus]|uniref:ATP-dependent 6-phosphofructokinase n=1 Tax=Geothermobacter hydrogeniphilus TaxID=1969733 RepID=A0A1X0Y2F2_9BACT|nr:ATP-dependent 6-phosphofructokinase [Geothermobacter hydrogeniphilus]ORJ59316.1 6-phosphofructokinase [Geothermobacter hydrogeniphilus]